MKFTLATVVAAISLISVVNATPLEERSGTKLTQAQAASRLSAAGIKWTSSGGCTSKNNPSCTSFDGLLSGTVNGAITLKRACACDLTITGGTETGHASGTYSHAKGYKLDFRPNTKLDSYIKNTFTKIATRSDGSPQWKSASGNIYAREGNHWDVIYF